LTGKQWLAYDRDLDVFKALADPTRRTILDELTERDGQTLFELCSRLLMKHGIDSTRQAISQHLDVLEGAGLVRVKRDGRYKFHYLDTTPLKSITDRWSTRDWQECSNMRIYVTSVFVDDQAKALAFYTNVLGFQKKTDIPLGSASWLTVVSPDQPDGTEVLLEPDGHPAAKPFKKALVEDGIPFTSFAVDDVQAESERLRAKGVQFTQEPTEMGGVTTAVFDDTCGNLIQIVQLPSST
jgi:DNA-binding transcriptional ArsR family regulator